MYTGPKKCFPNLDFVCIKFSTCAKNVSKQNQSQPKAAVLVQQHECAEALPL